MSEIVYVSGHKNPDTDSICSAIAYSYLLNATNKYNAVPVRLGEVNRETEYVLKRFGVEHPVLLKTVKQKVEDLNYDKVTVFSKDLTLKTAWFLLKQQNLKSAPILDEHGQLLGLLSTSNIIEGYMDQWDSEVLKKAKTPVENVIDTLEANVIYLNEALKVINGDIHIAAMSGNEAKKRIHENDVVIVGGDRSDDLEELISVKPSLIVLTGSLTADEKREIQVLETEYYEAADYEDSAVTDMYEEDVNPDEIMPCASNGTISWDVYAGVRRSTSSFHASSGQRIVLSVFSVEPFHSVRAGIIQPDGSKRYIIANGNDSHVFELTMSGSYRIYIQNETTESVHVEGAYSTY